MDCPFCGKEMRQGYIPAGDTLRWLPTGEELFTTSREDRVRLYYPLKSVAIDKGPEAHYCADCMRLVVNVPPQRETLRQRLAKRQQGKAETELEEYPGDEAPRRKKNGDKDPWED